jgi:hypothetical protein
MGGKFIGMVRERIKQKVESRKWKLEELMVGGVVFLDAPKPEAWQRLAGG